MGRTSIAAAAVIAASLACSQAQAADPIKLGFLTSLSGPFGILGTEMQRGLDVALEELDGKLGGVPVTVIRADDRSGPKDAVTAASKLIDQDQVQIVTGMLASNVILATTRSFIDAGIIVIGANGGPSEFAGKDCSPNAFFTAFQNDEWDEAAGKYMSDKGYKRVYFMGLDYQAGWDHIGGARRTYKGEVAGQVFTPISQVDFAPELAQLRAAAPDAVFVFYPGSPSIAFVKQFAQAGLQGKIPLFSADGLADELTFPGQGDAAVGIIQGTTWNVGLDNDENKKFVAAFVKKFGRVPTFTAEQQYDAMKLLNSAVAAVHGDISNKDAFRAALRKADFKSVRGPFKFNNNQFPIQDLYVQEVVKDDKGMHLALRGRVAEAWEDHYHTQCPMK